MAAVAPQVCPIVGTTNTILPPSHPDFDMDKPGLVCPVTKATTNHHHTLHKHPGISADTHLSAESCPALKETIDSPKNKSMDEAICPVVGPVSTILPPKHPATDSGADVCPVTNARLEHHKGKVYTHPNVADAPDGAVCPVVGHA